MLWMLPAAIGVTLLSVLLTGAALRYLQSRAILDHPNERSSHEIPTPRGGGIAVVSLTIAAWLIPVGDGIWSPTLAALCAAAVLAFVSWIDDVKSLTPLVRLTAQAIAVLFALSWLSEDKLLLQGLVSPWLDRFICAVLLIWFINLFNFMDGIDAISAAECIAVCSGLVLLSVLISANPVPSWLPLSLGAATLGFLWWNRPPARIFLGDVGSIPIGFLLGWMLLQIATAGYWAFALLLPLYYLADASITLARRAIRGEKVWQAHREHFYQLAVRSGRSHAAVSSAVFATNIGLVGLAWISLQHPYFAVAGGVLIVGLLILWMKR